MRPYCAHDANDHTQAHHGNSADPDLNLIDGVAFQDELAGNFRVELTPRVARSEHAPGHLVDHHAGPAVVLPADVVHPAPHPRHRRDVLEVADDGHESAVRCRAKRKPKQRVVSHRGDEQHERLGCVQREEEQRNVDKVLCGVSLHSDEPVRNCAGPEREQELKRNVHNGLGHCHRRHRVVSVCAFTGDDVLVLYVRGNRCDRHEHEERHDVPDAAREISNDPGRIAKLQPHQSDRKTKHHVHHEPEPQKRRIPEHDCKCAAQQNAQLRKPAHAVDDVHAQFLPRMQAAFATSTTAVQLDKLAIERFALFTARPRLGRATCCRC
mmetsp:Transcript_10569/g.28134  ORF Transcript_10569/g.28134 Transcript_10569/m.28134 type:complete len:324 (-) Transcript_10569:1131-2102(-)